MLIIDKIISLSYRLIRVKFVNAKCVKLVKLPAFSRFNGCFSFSWNFVNIKI